jgi:hypothetical protein|tara:strand:- start:85 stop:552 length:468 start_codon:yes stop_codon:yes gene_type:complete
MKKINLLLLFISYIASHGDHIPFDSDRITFLVEKETIDIETKQSNHHLQITLENDAAIQSLFERSETKLDELVARSLIAGTYYVELYDANYKFKGLVPLRPIRAFTSHNDGRSELIRSEKELMYFQLSNHNDISYLVVGKKGDKNLISLQGFSVK